VSELQHWSFVLVFRLLAQSAFISGESELQNCSCDLVFRPLAQSASISGVGTTELFLCCSLPASHSVCVYIGSLIYSTGPLFDVFRPLTQSASVSGVGTTGLFLCLNGGDALETCPRETPTTDCLPVVVPPRYPVSPPFDIAHSSLTFYTSRLLASPWDLLFTTPSYSSTGSVLPGDSRPVGDSLKLVFCILRNANAHRAAVIPCQTQTRRSAVIDL